MIFHCFYLSLIWHHFYAAAPLAIWNLWNIYHFEQYIMLSWTDVCKGYVRFSQKWHRFFAYLNFVQNQSMTYSRNSFNFSFHPIVKSTTLRRLHSSQFPLARHFLFFVSSLSLISMMFSAQTLHCNFKMFPNSDVSRIVKSLLKGHFWNVRTWTVSLFVDLLAAMNTNSCYCFEATI